MTDASVRVDWRHCPACGSTEVVHNGLRAIECRSCGFVYYQNMAAAVATIIEVDGRILVVVRAHDPGSGKWDLPGGFIEHGETAEEALVREVREELNIEITDMHFLCTAANEYPFKGVVYPVLDVYFVGRVRNLDAIAPADDVADYVLIEPDALDLDRFAFRSSRSALRSYLAGRSGR